MAICRYYRYLYQQLACKSNLTDFPLRIGGKVGMDDMARQGLKAVGAGRDKRAGK